MRSYLVRLLRVVYESLVAFGHLWILHPPPPPDVPTAPALTDPPPGHPERLCPELPLIAVERELARALRGDGATDPTGR